jgi:hypothetical protein
MSQWEKKWTPETQKTAAENGKMLDEMSKLLGCIEDGRVFSIKYHEDRKDVPFDTIEGIVSYIRAKPDICGDMAAVPTSWEDLCSRVEKGIQHAFREGALSYPHQDEAVKIVLETLRERTPLMGM